MKILVPIDGSEFSAHALDFIKSRATLLGHSPEIHLFTVLTPWPKSSGSPEEAEKSYREESAKLLGPAAAALAQKGIEATATWAAGRPDEKIAEVAEDENVDLIVMGSHGRSSLQGLLMGSVTNGVLARTTRPILVLRNKPVAPADALKVGVAVDGSKYGRAAVRYLIHNRDMFGADAQVSLINVASDYVGAMIPDMSGMALPALTEEEIVEQQKKEFHDIIDPLTPLLDKAGIKAKNVLLIGNPGDELAAFARRRHLDLIVMGSHGYGRFKAAVLGSTATRVAAKGDVPLLLIRHP